MNALLNWIVLDSNCSIWRFKWRQVLISNFGLFGRWSILKHIDEASTSTAGVQIERSLGRISKKVLVAFSTSNFALWYRICMQLKKPTGLSHQSDLAVTLAIDRGNWSVECESDRIWESSEITFQKKIPFSSSKYSEFPVTSRCFTKSPQFDRKNSNETSLNVRFQTDLWRPSVLTKEIPNKFAWIVSTTKTSR